MSKQLYILGAGASFPQLMISNELLLELSDEADTLRSKLENIGIQSRFSSLSLEYLKKTKNQEPFSVRAGTTSSPTDLGFEAAKQALEKAGIEPEQVGLILGATGTPYQTTPSEGQRIGERFGLKVPAYDLYSGAADLALQFQTLLSWKEVRVPNYVLCVCTNTPTQRVDYSSGIEGAMFGDGAVAFVVSVAHQGPIVVQEALARSYFQNKLVGEIDIFEPMRVDENYEQVVEERIDQMITQAHESKPLSATTVVFGGVTHRGEEKLLEKRQDLHTQCWSSVGNEGVHLGSSGYSLLSKNWQEGKFPADMLFLSAGIGESAGYVRMACSQGAI